MKMNNKGFSLVELLLALLISTVLMGSMTALIVYTSNSSRITNAKVALQDQAKDALNHIESFTMEAERVVEMDTNDAVVLFYDSKEVDKRFKKDTIDSTNIDEVLNFDSKVYTYWMSNGSVYFAQCTPDEESGGSPINPLDLYDLDEDDAKIYLLADDVEDFKVETLENERSGKQAAKISLKLKNDIAEYEMDKLVYLRNQ